MKKAGIIFVLLVSITLISAAEIQLSKESYEPGETLQAEIHAEFSEALKTENIFLYRERSIPIIYDIIKDETKHLLYIILPTQEGNYSIQIKNAEYSVIQGTTEEPIIKEFTIQETNQTALQFNPGFISAKNDFSVKIKNLGSEQEVQAEFESQKQNITLGEFQEKTLSFSVQGTAENKKTTLTINSYTIPVFLSSESEPSIISEERLIFKPGKISAVLPAGDSYLFEFYVENTGAKIENLSISFDSELISIEPEISEINANEKIYFNLSFSLEEAFETDIEVNYSDSSFILPINIDVAENSENISYNFPLIKTDNCSELGGIFCNTSAGEVCQDNATLTTDGLCCIGKCGAEKKEGGSWFIAILIFLILAAAIAIFFVVIKRKQKKFSEKNILKQKSEDYQKRMTNTPPEEVRRKLTKT